MKILPLLSLIVKSDVLEAACTMGISPYSKKADDIFESLSVNSTNSIIDQQEFDKIFNGASNNVR